MSEKAARKKRKEHQVLAGHRQEGSKFTILPANTQPVSYADYGVPEVVWIGVVIAALGLKNAADVMVAIGKAIRTEPPDMAPPPVLATFLGSLSDDRRTVVLHNLESEGLLEPVRIALAPFVSLYPKFPATWLSGEPNTTPETGFLPLFKKLLTELSDKTSTKSTLVLANLMYAAIVSGTVLVPPGEFDELDEIRHYPATEKSKSLAARLRSTATFFIGQGLTHGATREWSDYFWQRGLELEPVDYPSIWSAP